MMTQSVMTQAANLVGSAAGSVTFKGKQSGSGFNLAIDSSMKALQETAGNTKTQDVRKTTVKAPDTGLTNQKDKTVSNTAANRNGQAEAAGTNADAAKAGKTANSEKTANAEKTVNADTSKQIPDGKPTDTVTAAEKETKAETVITDDTKDSVIDEQLLAQIIGLLQAVSDAVMQKLNLSPEEFQKLLAGQGMTAADLLNSDNLQKFVLAGSGETNILAVLTNENLAGTMKEVLKLVEDMKTEAAIPLTADGMKEILLKAEAAAKLLPAQENTVNVSTVVQSPEEVPVKQAEAQIVNSVNPKKSSEEMNEKNVSAEKITAAADTDTEAVKGIASDASKAESLNNGNPQSKESTSNDNKPEPKAQDQFQMFIDNMVKATKESVPGFNESAVQAEQLRGIAQQIIERIRVSIMPDKSSLELQLNPESLGKVNLTVQSKNGVMTAQFVVQSEVSKEAIESQIGTLRETLNQQGIKVEAIEVTVSANAFEQNYEENAQNQADTPKNSSGRQISLEEALNMTETPEEESTAQALADTLGSVIDYTA